MPNAAAAAPAPARPLFGGAGGGGVLPSTRYQGSKRKLVAWLDEHTKNLPFDTALDAFGGTGSAAYLFKQRGKRVFYNDALRFNYYIGLALIENSSERLRAEDIDFVITKRARKNYPSFISDTFGGIYYTDEENAWLDVSVANIGELPNPYKRALAFYALFQACLAKRPFNLFHRKNLYLREANTPRGFGNKTTWDTPFAALFARFAQEANAAVADNGRQNQARCADVFELDLRADLVYIDPPYICAKGGGVNYLDFYHFLEGIVFYDSWQRLIDEGSKHKKIKSQKSAWQDKAKVHAAFDRLFAKNADSILVVSYRDNGIPSVAELAALLKKRKKTVEVKTMEYQYALSKKACKEVLLIAR